MLVNNRHRIVTRSGNAFSLTQINSINSAIHVQQIILLSVCFHATFTYNNIFPHSSKINPLERKINEMASSSFLALFLCKMKIKEK